MNAVQGRRKEERSLYIVRVVERSWVIYLVGFSIVSVKEEVVQGDGYIGEREEWTRFEISRKICERMLI